MSGPQLSKGDIVVRDNLPAHKGPRVGKLIKAVGGELPYPPPYTPDMNPIEKALFSNHESGSKVTVESLLADFG
jgi:transposase